MATANQIIEKAQSFIGIKENPSDSNNVIFNTWYYGRDVYGSAYPWCCTFVSYVFSQCGAIELIGGKSALCLNTGQWFKNQGRFYVSNPQPGDIVFFKYGTNSRWTNHIGIVESVNVNGSINTIEGNTSKTSDDNGGAVMRRVRSSNIVGYGRPRYSLVQNIVETVTNTVSSIISNVSTMSYPCKGIDVSSYQTGLNYSILASQGVKFAILKIMRKDLKIDTMFETHYQGFKNAGIPIYAVYNYSYATTADKAKIDAQQVIKHLNGRKIPVCLDIEDKSQQGLGENIVDIINTYQDTIEAAGLQFLVYTGLSFYNSYIKPYKGLVKCNNWWIARYYNGYDTMSISEEPNALKRPDVDGLVGWQYTSSLSIAGSTGKLDANILYSNIKQSSQIIPTSQKKFDIKAINNYVKKGTTALNVRDFPLSGKVLKTLKGGEAVDVYSVDIKSGWYKIHPSQNQWVSDNYISSDLLGTVTANILNIRLFPSSSSGKIGTYSYGTTVKILRENNNWYLTPKGWVSAKYISLN